MITGVLAAVVTAGLGLVVETWRGDGALAREIAADEHLDRVRAARGWLPSDADAVASASRDLREQGVELLVAREPFALSLPHGEVRGTAPARVPSRVARVVAEELARYPRGVLRRIGLWHVVLCDGLSEGAVPIPSLPHVDHSLLLDVSARGAYLRRLIHHEVFHFIDLADDGAVRRDPAWASLHEPAFPYGLGGRTMRRPAAADAAQAPAGFITPYATSALEEDKAETFAFAVAAPAMLLRRAHADPVVAAKVEALRLRLAAVDPALPALLDPVVTKGLAQPAGIR